MRQYYLTLCVHMRHPVFKSGAAVPAILAQFRQSTGQRGFALLTYCFMPDHLHLLCEARTAEADLIAFVRDAKQRTGYAFARRTGTRLWQRGFYDHVLRSEDDVLAVVRYIMANPVRDGLAREVGEYPFCGSDLFTTDEIRSCSEIWEPGEEQRPSPRPRQP
jgi:putative transposase